jgi:hypothetical protein
MLPHRIRRISQDALAEQGRGPDLYGMSERRSYGVALESRLGQAYNEEAFRYFLDIERRRAARAQRPVVLLLMDVKEPSVAGADIDALLAAKLFSGLLLCLRETDVIGWYRENRIVGAVLNQLDRAPGPNVPLAVRERVSGAIRKGLPPEIAGRLRVRVYQLRPRLKG